MTSEAICAAGGASATQGDVAVTSKNTDPDKCTAERTSDNASVLIDMNLHVSEIGRSGLSVATSRTIGQDDNNSGRSSKKPGSPIIQPRQPLS